MLKSLGRGQWFTFAIVVDRSVSCMLKEEEEMEIRNNWSRGCGAIVKQKRPVRGCCCCCYCAGSASATELVKLRHTFRLDLCFVPCIVPPTTTPWISSARWARKGDESGGMLADCVLDVILEK